MSAAHPLGRGAPGAGVTSPLQCSSSSSSQPWSPGSSSCPTTRSTPGQAPQVSSLIKVPSSDRHSHRGSVLLVYVELTPLRALYYPFFWLDPNAAIYPSSEILGTETAAQYATEGEIDMSTAQQAATVVALDELGYKVPVKALGALIYGILPGSPAAASLKVGEVISAVDGVRVSSYVALSASSRCSPQERQSIWS